MRKLTAAAALAALLVAAPGAAARSVPAFTATPAGARTLLLDASSSVCEFGPCGYTWRWDDGSRPGVTIGRGVRITYRFPEAGPKTIVLTVSGHCYDGATSFCPTTLSKQVTAPGGASTSPPPPPPPASAPTAAARPGQTLTVTAARAKVDREPGRRQIGTLRRGAHFRVDRVHRVEHGHSKGLWYHGKGRRISGWVRATAFA